MGIPYRLLAASGPDQAFFAFAGRFQGREIIWDACLGTLTRYHAEQPKAAQPVVRRAFMQIGNETAHGRAIRVMLDIPVIDEAAILSTIIMVRRYKRLHIGRHEFGEPRNFPPHTL